MEKKTVMVWASINKLPTNANDINPIIQFDDGSICRYIDKFPFAIATHFLKEVEVITVDEMEVEKPMLSASRKTAEEIIYKNSHDCSEGLIIRFENIHKVVDLLSKSQANQFPESKVMDGGNRMFQVLDAMNLEDSENKTRLVAISNSFIEGRQVKAGAKITMGIDQQGLLDIFNGKALPILMLVDKDEYMKRKDAAPLPPTPKD